VAAFFYLRVVLYMYSGSALAPAVATEPGGAVVDEGSGSPAAGPTAAGIEAGAGASGAARTGAAPTALLVARGAEPRPDPVPPALGVALGICLVVTVLFGVWPAPLVDFAHHAAGLTQLFR